MKTFKPQDYKIEETPWGSLTWYTSKELGNTETMTVGKCRINVGDMNPRHSHPNCEEVIHVLKGRIIHTYNNEEMIMEEGDTICVPVGVPHNARNIGDQVVELAIAFSSAERKPVKE